MRNLRKILAVVVVVAFIAMSSIVPAFADTALSASTQTCADLGMLQGTGSGVTADYAATTPTRIQAAVLLLRLKGLEADAKAFTGTDNFADASSASWAAPIMAYLKANPAVGFAGVGSNNFDPNAPMTAQQYYKVVLTALGYVQDTDFAYADTITFAQNTAKLAMAGNVANFTIDSLAAATVEGLKATVKGGTDTLIAQLVAAGKVDAAKAAADGLVSTELTATAAATGAKKLTVTFSQAVADTTKATFAVTRDGVNVTTTATWASDKKSVDLVPNAKLIAGNYAITVKGLTSTDMTLNIAGVTDEKATKITLSSDKLAAVRDTNQADPEYNNYWKATITYKVFNQYGEDITSSAICPSIQWTSSFGTADDDNSGTVTVNYPDGSVNYFVVGQTVVLTGVMTDPSAAGVTVTSTLTVGTPASVDSVTFDKLYNVDGSTLATDSDFSTYTLLFSAKDQYGNDMSYTNCNADLYVYSNNPAVVDINNANANPVLQKQGPNADQLGLQLKKPVSNMDGTAAITMVSKTTGKTFNFNVTVAKQSHVQKFSIQAPADAVASGETGITIPFTALDQNGAAVTDWAELNNDVTLSPKGDGAGNAGTTGYLHWAHDYVNNVTVLKFEAPAVASDTQIVLMGVCTNGSGSVSQLTITVKKLATPNTVDSLTSDVSTNLTIGASTMIEGDYVNILDQYGRSYDLKGHLGAALQGPVDPVKGYDTRAGNAASAGLYRLVVRADNKDETQLTIASGTGNNAVSADPKDGFALYSKDDTYQVDLTAAAIGTVSVDVVLQQCVAHYIAGTQTIDGYNYVDVPGASSLTQNFTINKKGNYTAYTMDDPGTMYDVGQNGVLAGNTAADYDKTIKVYGQVGSTKYLLDPTQYFVTTDSSKVNVAGNVVTAGLAADGVTLAPFSYDTNASTATFNLTVTINADTNPQTITKAITVSKSGPAAASISLDSGYDLVPTGALPNDAVGQNVYLQYTEAKNDNAGEISITAPAATFSLNMLRGIVATSLVVKDQYGVQYKPAYLFANTPVSGGYAQNLFITNMAQTAGNNPIDKTITGYKGAGATTLAAGDTFSVTYVVQNQRLSFKVVIN